MKMRERNCFMQHTVCHSYVRRSYIINIMWFLPLVEDDRIANFLDSLKDKKWFYKELYMSNEANLNKNSVIKDGVKLS
ncbi:hypothetical protein BWK60_12245 [Flavobacterium covae]|nr:hypothetical protein BWK60_12245 [Flavobacterium covae]